MRKNRTEAAQTSFKFLWCKYRSFGRTGLEIPLIIQSLKLSNVELGEYIDGQLFKCNLSIDINSLNCLDLIHFLKLVVGFELIQR